MRKLTSKVLAVLFTIMLLFGSSYPVFAMETIKATNEEKITDSSSVIRRAYYDPSTFSFHSRNVGNTRWYDGGHMAAEITASSDVSGLTMQVTAHIVGYKSVTWNVKVDGKMHKKDWISFNTSSGRNVYFEYSCVQNPSAKITVHNKSYSW